MKLKWKKHCVLAIVDDDDGNSTNIILTITKLYVPVVTLSAKDSKKTIKTS